VPRGPALFSQRRRGKVGWRIASSDAGKIKNAGRKEAEARCDRCRKTALAGRARDVEQTPFSPPTSDRAVYRRFRMPRAQARDRTRRRAACRAARARCRPDERSGAPRLPRAVESNIFRPAREVVLLMPQARRRRPPHPGPLPPQAGGEGAVGSRACRRVRGTLSLACQN
jgi:hypothetical protein